MKVHMSLPAKDLEKTVNFYSQLFGEGPVKVKADYAKFDPKSIPLNISFHKADNKEKIDTSRHLGIEISAQKELDMVYNRLKGENLIHLEKVEGVCCYANQDKFWVRDPSGFQWEIYRLLEDSEVKEEEKIQCCEEENGEAKPTCCA